MEYIGVGAYVNGRRPASKKAVREALKTDPSTVVFDVTDALGPYAGTRIVGAAVPAGVTLTLVGPDPYTSRKFYGNVKIGKTGVTLA